MFGFLLIDKPLGISSHDVIYRLRRTFGIKKIGHAGTLDPLATGLLVVGVGAATRFISYLQLEPKVYDFGVEFGRTTESYDSEGAVTSERELPDNLATQIDQNLARFRGEIVQVPPMYSAVNKDGRPLYSYARKGEEVERAPRRIRIEELTMTQLDGAFAKFHVVCSSGTYVRSIAHDLGEVIGCGAHATSIRRTGAGRFTIVQAVCLESVGAQHLIMAQNALEPIPTLTLNEHNAALIRDGRTISMNIVDGLVYLLRPDGSPLGIAELNGGTLVPKSLVPREETVAQN